MTNDTDNFHSAVIISTHDFSVMTSSSSIHDSASY